MRSGKWHQKQHSLFTDGHTIAINKKRLCYGKYFIAARFFTDTPELRIMKAMKGMTTTEMGVPNKELAKPVYESPANTSRTLLFNGSRDS